MSRAEDAMLESADPEVQACGAWIHGLTDRRSHLTDDIKEQRKEKEPAIIMRFDDDYFGDFRIRCDDPESIWTGFSPPGRRHNGLGGTFAFCSRPHIARKSLAQKCLFGGL